MGSVFENLPWSLNAPAPWRIEDCDHCVEITQPDGIGAMHISNARKKHGVVAPTETLAHVKSDCPESADIQEVCCGDFFGHVAEYTDWHTDRFWRVWFVACGQDLLHVTYTCKRGEEELEADEASKLLLSLRSRS